MTSLRIKSLNAMAVITAIAVAVTMSGGATTSASVEDGGRRVDIQFSNSGDQDVGGIAVSDDGTVFVAGATDTDFAGEEVSADDDALLFATDRSGDIAWAVTSGGIDEAVTDEYEYFNDVIVHSNGDIYVVGQFDGDGVGLGDAVIERYSRRGVLRDREVWGDVGDFGWDEAQSLIEGPDGNLYVVGYSEYGFDGHDVEAPRINDAFVRVFEPDLDFVDSYWWDEFLDNRAYSITFDDEANFYIAGRTDNGGSWDWFVARFGDDDWFIFGDGAGGDDRAWDIQYSPADDGMLWVSGYLGGLDYPPEDPVVLDSQFAFYAMLDPEDGSLLGGSPFVAALAESESRSVTVDRNGHAILTWTFDGDHEFNLGYLDDSGGSLDSGLSHVADGDTAAYWDGFIATVGDDEIVNSIIDGDGNLWLTGTTSGDLAASNGGDDDIFLSLYRVRDPRRTSRSSTHSASWSVLSGSDRFDSSIVASRTSPEGGSVILVNGRNQVDLLLASMFDSARGESLDGRILFVEAGATQVPESLRIEWDRLARSAVTVIGGPDSVSDEFLASLANGTVPITRVQSSQVMTSILDASVAGSSLVLVGDYEPTNVLQAVSWANSVGGTVLPLSAALYELDRLKAIGFSSMTLVGSPDVNGLAALVFIESSLGLTAQKVSSASPSDQSATMAAVLGSRPDVAVVSPMNWVDAVHANAMRLPLIWAGPGCVQPGATAALASLSPTRSIRGFGGAMAALGDPRSALGC